MKKAFLLAVACVCALSTLGQGRFALANIGDLKLTTGEILRACQVGYRTFGKLNQEKSNVILFPAYFTGTSHDMAGSVGPGKVADSTRYFVVILDPLGNGVSSSPSTSKRQPGKEFPKITVADMVNAEHLLVTRTLGLRHVHAVVGISMGGMQALQWMVAYPTFMDKVVSIVGTPAQTSQDLLLWSAQLQAIEASQACGDDGQKAMPTVAAIHQLAIVTPQNRVRENKVEDFETYLANVQEGVIAKNAYDWAAQLRAMMGHDIYAFVGKPKEALPAQVKANLLLVVSRQDQMVNPGPSRELGHLLGAQIVELTSDCGHLAPGCEGEKVSQAVARFLAAK